MVAWEQRGGLPATHVDAWTPLTNLYCWNRLRGPAYIVDVGLRGNLERKRAGVNHSGAEPHAKRGVRECGGRCQAKGESMAPVR